MNTETPYGAVDDGGFAVTLEPNPNDDTPPPADRRDRVARHRALVTDHPALPSFPSDAWAGDGKARTDPHALSVTITAALRPLDPARREAVLNAARAALLDPQALALVVAVRKGGAGTLGDFEAALALARHVLG